MIKKLRFRVTVLLTAFTSIVLAVILAVLLWYSINQAKQSNIQNLSSNSSYMAIALAASVDTEPAGDTTWLTAMEKANGYIIDTSVNGESISFTPGSPAIASRDTVIEAANTVESIELLDVYSQAYPLSISLSSSSVIDETAPIIFDYNIVDDSEFIAGNAFSIEGKNAEGIIANFSSPDFGIASVFQTTPLTSFYDPYETIEADGISYRVNAIKFQQYNSTTDNHDSYTLRVIDNLSMEKNEIAYICLAYISIFLLGTAVLTTVSWLLSKLVVMPTEESIRKQTEFVAAASHELRSPLAVLKCSLSAVKVSDEAEKNKYITGAESEADRMSCLIDDLLLLAGNDSGRWTLTSGLFDADSLLIEKAEQYELIANKKNQNFRLDLPDAVIGEVNGDKQRISQILSILLDNAMEYSGSKSEIILSAQSKKNKIYINVADNGKGIDTKTMSRIFERFYRADKNRSDKTHFGLGLSIAKELAQLHGGKITVESEPGTGSTFTLQLPRK